MVSGVHLHGVQTLLLFCATMVSVLSVVPADVATNAMSTSSTMDHEVDKLIVTEAALLFVPICAVAVWQLFVFRNDMRVAFAAAAVAVASTASTALEAISGLHLPYMARCRACIGSFGRWRPASAGVDGERGGESSGRRRPASVGVDDSLRKSLLAEGGGASEAEVESLAVGSDHDQ